jgi:ferrous iron transport protein A
MNQFSHLTLDLASIGEVYVINAITPPSGMAEWARALEEIGFIPGESVRVMARGIPGGDPLSVRVGASTFALRRAEASCVHIALAEMENVA